MAVEAAYPVDETLRVVKGRIDPDAFPVFAIVRNERWLLPAFLDHYRRLGVGRFLFLDDRSDDGTLELLSGQPDCVLLASDRRYGDRVGGMRCVHVWKTQIPRQLLPGRWALCADADELLFIPGIFDSLPALMRELDARGVRAAAAAMVDFHPESLERMETLSPPSDREALLDACPWFDRPADASGRAAYGGARERLLRRFDISLRGLSKTGLDRLRRRLRDVLFGKRYVKAISTRKVPLVKWSPDLVYTGSHTLNVAPDPRILLPLAHFKFTADLPKKIVAATASRAYSDGSRAYFEYEKLLGAMKAGGGSFLGPRSVRFTGPEDFERAGLMAFPEA